HLGITRMVSDLVKIRTEQKNESDGLKGQYTKVIHFNNDNKVLAYARSSSDDFSNSTVVLLNLSNDSFENYTIGVPDAKQYNLVFNSDWKGYDEEFTDMVVSPVTISNENYDSEPYKAVTNLPAYTALIFTPSN
ncbi:alpha amylase C-terminal domain-containing protein, partial [Flavobacterium sp.]|uniref:alpha amylase C-terminal domain-containing protein n=1 Tax=Flavobacterium sp. TaxID=239 RepID=UPI003C51FB25